MDSEPRNLETDRNHRRNKQRQNNRIVAGKFEDHHRCRLDAITGSSSCEDATLAIVSSTNNTLANGVL